MINLTEHGTPKLNTVHHCRAEALLSALDTGSIDLIITSPPYDNLRTYNGFSWNFEYIAQQSYRVLKPGGVLVWVVGDATVDGSETLTSFEQVLYFKKMAGFTVETMIFQKNASSPNTHHPRYLQEFEYMFVMTKGEKPRVWNPIMRANSGGSKAVAKVKTQTNGKKVAYGGNREVRQPCPLGNVWVFNVGAAAGDNPLSYEHPAVFPEALVERHIISWTNPGDTVLDFFGGSGTSADVAQRLGRNWLTNDISLEYCDLMERRLAQPYTPSFLPLLEAV
jgi:DNA modification methylase